MPSKRRSRREYIRVRDMLQDAADRLTAELPDRMRIGITREEILWGCTTWSSALTRQHFSGETGRRMLSVAEWREGAEDEIVDLFGEALEAQRERWESALALGLVRGDELVDLPPGEMMVDRTLLAMLETKGFDMRAAGAMIGDHRHEYRLDDRAGTVSVLLDGRSFFATHEGLAPPTIRTWLRIGRAEYDGDCLIVDGQLPDTIVCAARGRALGATVATGVPALDRRLITSSESLPPGTYPQPRGPRTAFDLAPDAVKLGDTHGSIIRPTRVSKAPSRTLAWLEARECGRLAAHT